MTYFIIGLILIIIGGILAILTEEHYATRSESGNKQNTKRGK